MAKTTAGAGYKELKRAGNYIAPQINAGADRLAASARQQKQLNATENARQEKRMDEANKAASVDSSKYEVDTTGFTTRDDMAKRLARKGLEKAGIYAENARQAKPYSKEYYMWIDKKNSIGQDFKNTVSDEVTLKEVFKTHRDNYLNGKVDDDDWLEFATAFENFDYDIDYDEYDNKVITAFPKDDKGERVLDESGNPLVITKNWSDLVNTNDRPHEVVQVSGKGGLVDELLVGFGKRKYDEVGENFITTKQTWDKNNELAFEAKVRGLQSDDRSMYSLLKQATGGKTKKKSGFTEEDKTKVKDYLYKQVRAQYGEEESNAIRQLTPEEKLKEAARARALQRRGQDLGVDKAENANEIAWARLALDEWKAKNPAKEGKVTKDDEKEAKVASLHEIAKKIAATDLNDNSVQSVLDETGLGFVIGTDWQMGAGVNNLLGGDYNEFDIGNVKNINQKDVFKIVKGLAKKAGLELEDTDIRKVLMGSKEEPTTKPTAAELIAKYSKN